MRNNTKVNYFVIHLWHEVRLFPRSRHAPTIQTSLSSQGVLSNDREDILQNLLRVELREAARHYLRRTRVRSSIEYVFFMSDVPSEE